jgi:hypothetical protein
MDYPGIFPNVFGKIDGRAELAKPEAGPKGDR